MRDGTGLTPVDAADDYARARRRAALSRVVRWLREGPGAASAAPLTFDEMLDALGQRGQQQAGVRTVPLSAILGSVDRDGQFDTAFRPTDGRSRARWESVARAMRDGLDLPPVDLFLINGAYFVQDGHHRVSVARELGSTHVDAHVTEVLTHGTGRPVTDRGDLQMRLYERILDDRVPWPTEHGHDLRVAEPRSLAVLAETIEAWAARVMLAEQQVMAREEVARRFHLEEYAPAVELFTEAGLVRPDELPVDAYLRISCQRYWISHCHAWDDEVVAALLDA